jgi:hypothetical protein
MYEQQQGTKQHSTSAAAAAALRLFLPESVTATFIKARVEGNCKS